MSAEFQALEEEWATAVARGDVAAAADLLADDFVLTSVGGVSSRILTWEATIDERDLTGRYAVTDVFTRDGGRWRPAWRVSVRLGEPA